MKTETAKQNIETKGDLNRVGQGKVLTGVVVSTKMKDTIVVEVARLVKHPRYGKYIERHKRYKAHDAGNTKKEGDKVVIVECAPISKDKHFKVKN